MSHRRYFGMVTTIALSLVLAQPWLSQQSRAQEVPAQVTAAPDAEAAVAQPLVESDVPAVPGDAAAGADKAAACAACHGADGNSADPQYPKIAGQHETYMARQLALFKDSSRDNAIMLGFSSILTPQDMRDIGAYFATQKALPGIADDSQIAAGPNQGRKFYEIGEALYRGGDIERGIPACMACHGPSGRGNPGSGYPALGGQHSAYTTLKLTDFRSGLAFGKEANGNANTIMVDVAKQLTDEEIASVSSYIEGLHAAQAVAGAAK